MGIFSGLYHIVKVVVLLLNAVLILSPDRFLWRIGCVGDSNSRKERMGQIVVSMQTVLKFPIIVVNVLLIVYEALLG